MWWLWKPYPYLGEKPKFLSLMRTALLPLSYVPLIVFSILGFWLHQRHRTALMLFIGMFTYVTIISALFMGVIRYRVPYEPYLIVMAAAGLQGSYAWLHERRRNKALMAK
jgi:hypothetical protein